MTTRISGNLGVNRVAPNTVDKEDLTWVPPLTKEYVSSEQTIVLGGALTLPHDLGASPKLVQLWLRCVVAEHGYSVGDLVQITNTADSIGSVAGIGWSVVPDATNINLRAGNTAFATLIIKNTGAGTTVNTVANWRLIVRAWA